jgi:hypothetical protein
VTLGSQVVDFIGLNLLDDPDEVRGIGQVSIVELELGSLAWGSW